MSKPKTVNTAGIVSHFGGKHQIVSDYNTILKLVISTKAVEKWVEREAIPMKHIFHLEKIAEKRNIQFELKEFVN